MVGRVHFDRASLVAIGSPSRSDERKGERGRLVFHQIREALSERRGIAARDCGQSGQRDLIGEVVAAQSDHIATSDLVLLAVDINQSNSSPPGLRIQHLCEGNRYKVAVLDGDHRITAAFQEELGGAVAKVTRVFQVERNRVSAAQLVPDILDNQTRGQVKLRQASAQSNAKDLSKVDLGKTEVAMLVALNRVKAF